MIVHIHTESCLAAIRTVFDFTVYDKLEDWGKGWVRVLKLDVFGGKQKSLGEPFT